MANVLLINPSYMGSYGGNKMSVVSPIFPVLSLATIGAGARERGHKVEILDLSYIPYDFEDARKKIEAFAPDIVGITALTPAANQMIDLSYLIKDISEKIVVVGGGPHASSLPKETLLQSKLDAVIVGEGDFTFADICDGEKFENIKGIYWYNRSEIQNNGPRLLINDLDSLPMPAWDLFDPKIYADKISRLLVRRPPIVTIEFSRGCVFKCDYCASKMTMALGYRNKSPERCAREVQHLYDLGFREFMVADDIFTSDEKWAVKVCDAIADLGLDIPWTCTNGIRVESADENLFSAMHRAGCYRVSFGFESGNDEVLKKFGKGGRASIEKGSQAVKIAREAGIETNGYFMVGLSSDTEATMIDTIEFAKKLPLDLLKFSVTTAFPGTEMFNIYVAKGLVKSYNWDDYHIYSDVELFAHEFLEFETIQTYMKKVFIETIILSPGFWWRRLIRGIKTNEFFWDAYYLLQFTFAKTTNTDHQIYYARDRWTEIDFSKQKFTPSVYQKVGSNKLKTFAVTEALD